MTIPSDFLEELRNRVPVSEVVRQHVQLRKQGREWAGLSPFNKEKTPSFFVNDEKRFYHCFSSGKHGDVFSFLTDATGLTFREAVETVAALAGMEVPSEGAEVAERRRVVRGVQDTLAAATAYFETQLRLPVGREALAYLHQRGLDDATIRRFRLGYAPPAHGGLGASLGREGIAQEALIDAGLLKRRDDGRMADYFRDRVIFPITDRQGQVIAFGGRILGDGQPKYLNSPETAAFHKGSVLYGLAQAREAAHKNGRVLVVEGYMDVIALAQAGIAEVVAPLGTALGEEQIRLLWTLAAEPVLCLDGDRAGHSAAVRGAERALPLLQPGRSLRFARLPPGEDPDTLVRKGGAESIEALIESAESLASVIWQSEWERHAPTSPERRAAFHRSILGQVRRIGDETVRRYYEQSIRERLQDAFAPPSRPSGFRRGTRPQGSRWPEASGPSVHRRANPRRLAGQRQRTLLGILVLYPDLIEEFAEALAQLSFTDGALERLRNAILGVGAVLNDLDAGSIASQLSTTTGHQSVNWEREVRPLLASACEDARAALGGASIDGQEALMRARGAADQLVRALEQDTVRADVAGQIDGLSEAPDTLDRLKAIVAAERLRAPTEP